MAMDALAPTVTVTVAVAIWWPRFATTVLANVPRTEPAVNMPDEVIEPPPLTIDHSGVIGTLLPSRSVARAVNCCVTWMPSDGDAGETTIDVSELGPPTPFTLHAVDARQTKATDAMTRAMS